MFALLVSPFEPDVNEMAGNRRDENSELERMDEHTETGKLVFHSAR